jgi:hypothetical protein
VPTLGIVEALDVVEHVGLSLIARSIYLSCSSFGLERREEAFHRRIVPDVARPAHRAGDAVIGHQALELLAGVLTAAIGVMQSRDRMGCDLP